MQLTPVVLPSPPKKGRLPVWAGVIAFVTLATLLTAFALDLHRSTQDAVVLGRPVPPIQLTSFDHQTLSTTDASLHGKVVVVNFWASWCNPCANEANLLQQAWLHYQPGGQVAFLGIDYVDTEPDARAYLGKYGVTYPNGPDLGTMASRAFRIQGVPETYIIDRQGKLAYKEIGPFQSLPEVLAAIDPLLK